MTIICYQVFPCGRLLFSLSSHYSCLVFYWFLSIQLKPSSSPELFLKIKNLFLTLLLQRKDALGSRLSWSLTICFFVALYFCVCSCVVIIIHIFSTHFAINLFYLHIFKTKTNFGTTAALYTWMNEIKTKTKSRHIQIDHMFYSSI